MRKLSAQYGNGGYSSEVDSRCSITITASTSFKWSDRDIKVEARDGLTVVELSGRRKISVMPLSRGVEETNALEALLNRRRWIEPSLDLG